MFGTPGETRCICANRRRYWFRRGPTRRAIVPRTIALNCSSLLGCNRKSTPMTGCFFCLAPPARLELTTLRLGGARSLQVSYGGIFSCVWIFYSNNSLLSRKCGTFFSDPGIYCCSSLWKGAENMTEHTDPNMDLDDLIFNKEDGGPSER